MQFLEDAVQTVVLFDIFWTSLLYIYNDTAALPSVNVFYIISYLSTFYC